jgi:hypothetical protein
VNRLGWSPEKALVIPKHGSDKGKEFTFRGKSKTLREWSKELDIGLAVLKNRIFTYKWTVRKAFTTPQKYSKRYITYKGETLSITQWANRLGVSRNSLCTRLRLGWTAEQTLETPVKQYMRASHG